MPSQEITYNKIYNKIIWIITDLVALDTVNPKFGGSPRILQQFRIWVNQALLISTEEINIKKHERA